MICLTLFVKKVAQWKTFIPEICNSSSEIVTNIFFQRPFSPILAQKLSCCFYKEKEESPLLGKFLEYDICFGNRVLPQVQWWKIPLC